MKSVLVVLTLALSLGATAGPSAARAEGTFATVPRAAWADADPADSLYRAARKALTQKDYEAAAQMFDAIASKYPRSEYAADALYWKGFALYRNNQFDAAVDALEAQGKRYPNAPTHADASALLIQLKGRLARRGDADARRDVDSAAARSGQACGDMEVQTAALDAVQQMDAERVIPLLKRVLARRDPCSLPLRKNALFILAQKQGPDREQILLDVAKHDPEPSIRQDAVFHLQQAKSDLAVDALEDILLHSDEKGVRQNAIFALAQVRNEKSKRILRAFAMSKDAPTPLRSDAIFQLAQSRDAADEAFLRELYGKVSEQSIKADVMFQVASHPSPETTKWLSSVIMDPNESFELKKNALFHLSQQRAAGTAEIVAVYDRAPVNMRKEMIFFIAQLHDAASLDKLISIAKTDPSPEIRKEALFQIGQSKDPKALKALEDIVAP